MGDPYRYCCPASFIVSQTWSKRPRGFSSPVTNEMALPKADGWVDWTEGYRNSYEPIDPSQVLPCIKRRVSWIALVGGLVFCIAGLWAASTVQKPRESSIRGSMTVREPSNLKETEGKRSLDPIGVVVRNEYNVEDNPTTFALYPWSYIAEPHRETTFEVVQWPNEELGEYAHFRWGIFVSRLLMASCIFLRSLMSQRYACYKFRCWPHGDMRAVECYKHLLTFASHNYCIHWAVMGMGLRERRQVKVVVRNNLNTICWARLIVSAIWRLSLIHYIVGASCRARRN